jgi:hypothetical protein
MSDTETAAATPASARGVDVDRETRTFSVSIMISAVRCMLTYVVLPFLLPLVGLSGTVGPALGLIIGPVAIGANVFTIRRFWATDHRLKRPVTVICSGVLVMLAVLLVRDIADLLG